MATQNKTFLDLAGLQVYDTAIKNWANSVNQVAFKKALTDADGNYLYLYKDPNAVLGDTPDATISLGGGDLSAKLDALASICGATWNTATSEYDITLDSTFSVSTETIVDALNELKGQINILNGNDTTAGSVAKSIKDAVEALDVSEFALASVSSGIVTIKGIKEVDGQIEVGTSSANDVTLAKVATTGASEDVSYDHTASGLSAANVKAAIDELQGNIEDIEAAGELTIVDEATPTAGYLKTYSFYQGDSTVAANLKGKIDIPKDFLVKSGSVVVDPAGQPAGTYIELVINVKSGTAADETIYINVADLVDAYTAKQHADEVQLTISATNVISAAIVDVAATKVTYIEAGSGVARESVGAALTRLDGNASTPGSVDYKVATAVAGLDTGSPVAIATYAAGTVSTPSTITFPTGISETDGIIGAESDTVTMSTITSAEIAALFS